MSNALARQLTTLHNQNQALERDLKVSHAEHVADMVRLSAGLKDKRQVSIVALETELEQAQELITNRLGFTVECLQRENDRLRRENDRLRHQLLDAGIRASSSSPSPGASPRGGALHRALPSVTPL